MLRFPFVFGLVMALAVALAAPSLRADFYCDDQTMVLRLEGVAPSPIPGPFHLYTFASGGPGDRRILVDNGPLPWWTIDGLRLSFCRPLSSALFALDHALAGRRPLLYHLHSIGWYLAAVLAAAVFFRRLLPERDAAVAALLFTVSPAHWMLAAWPSARHVAVSGTFAIMAILLHLRAREGAAKGAPLASLGALASAAIALAGGEAGLGVFGYVAAYEAIGRTDKIGVRLRAFAPWVALFVVYAWLYRASGFGVYGSGSYIDPVAEPGAYLALLPSRLAVFVEAALLGVPSELTAIAPRAIPALATLGVGIALVFAALLRRALQSAARSPTPTPAPALTPTLTPAPALTPAPEPRSLGRSIAWLLVGAALAIFPGAAGIPGDRILFLPNLGIIAALSIVLLHAGARMDPGAPTPASQGARGGKRARWIAWAAARAGVALFALVHVVFAPLLFGLGAAQLASSSHASLALASAAEIPPGAGVNVFGIGLSDPLVGMYLAPSLALAPRPQPLPRAVELLSMSSHDHRVRRIDDRTLEITVLRGGLLEGGFESAVRTPHAPLQAGDEVALDLCAIRIIDAVGGHPTRFSVTFDRSVADPSIALLVWRDGALRALSPPSVGEEVLVRHERGPMGI